MGEHLLDAVPFRSFVAHNLDKIVIGDGVVHIIGQRGFNALIKRFLLAACQYFIEDDVLR